jgi:Uma2 family endonuclease
MATAIASPPLWTLADLAEMFGPMPALRIRLTPPPGTATEQDVLEIHLREDRLYELVDGVLVEKDMGFYEARLAVVLIVILETFADRHNRGIVVGPDGMMRLAPGLIRIPDVSFISWKRLPRGRTPRKPIPKLAPDLAVEVLSAGNTKKEMDRKLRDYFQAGVRLVWFADPKKHTVTVYTAPDQETVLTIKDTLDGGAVLPGFSLPLRELFGRADRRRRGKSS